MKSVREFMTPDPITVECRQSLADALEVMGQNQIRHLPVLDGGKLVGVLSERDALRFAQRKRVQPEWIAVAEVMTPEPYVVAPDESMASVAEEMARRHYGSALVIDQDRVVGLVTTTDALWALSSILASAS